MVLENILAQFSYFSIILILALITTFVSSLAYKYTTDQNLIKRIKLDIKKLREKQKKHMGDQKKIMAIQSEMMSKNTTLLKQSFKPMIYTFLPLILIFAWMSANIVYEPISPGQEFTVETEFPQTLNLETGELTILNTTREQNIQTWILRAENTGEFDLRFNGPNISESYTLIVSNNKNYSPPVQNIGSGITININNELVRPMGDLSFFGWKPGWLGTYIVFSLFSSLLFRKILGVA